MSFKVAIVVHALGRGWYCKSVAQREVYGLKLYTGELLWAGYVNGRGYQCCIARKDR